MISKLFTSSLIFNILLIISFSISVNTFTEIQILNYIFYIFFHLTFIYFLFYHYHYSIYFIGLVYGILFDVLLINDISSHLVSFILLILIYVLIKKYLFLLSAYQISLAIFITLITVLFFEAIFAYVVNNITFSYTQMINYLTISCIIFVPSILFFNKLDK